MDEYKEAVEVLSAQHLDNEFTNKGKSHASIVLTNMLKTTEESFYMYTGSLNGEVCEDPEFMKALEKIILSDRKLYIFLESLPPRDQRSKALTKVLNASDNNQNVEVKVAPHVFTSQLQQRLVNGNLHFAVSDDRAFRLEVDPDNFKAICNFNDPVISKRFSELFQQHFQNENVEKLSSGS